MEEAGILQCYNLGQPWPHLSLTQAYRPSVPLIAAESCPATFQREGGFGDEAHVDGDRWLMAKRQVEGTEGLLAEWRVVHTTGHKLGREKSVFSCVLLCFQ